MITISIVNPSEHSPVELRLLGDYLYNCAHEKDAPIATAGPSLETGLESKRKFDEHMAARREPHFTTDPAPIEHVDLDAAPLPTIIDPADHPDAGAPTIAPIPHAIQDIETFDMPEPTAVFGVPSAPPAPVATDDGERDSAGVVWNPDLHSRTKSKNADGTWRAKRGVTKDVPAAPATEVIDAPWPFTPPTQFAESPVPVAPPMPPAPPAAVVPAVPPAPNVVSFPALMQKISPAVTSGRITQEQVVALVTKHGVPSLPLLSTRPDLIPVVSAELDAMLS